jgi:hypothetical protein
MTLLTSQLLLLLRGCWQKTRGSWVRAKRLYFSWQSKWHEHLVYVNSPHSPECQGQHGEVQVGVVNGMVCTIDKEFSSLENYVFHGHSSLCPCGKLILYLTITSYNTILRKGLVKNGQGLASLASPIRWCRVPWAMAGCLSQHLPQSGCEDEMRWMCGS